MVQRFREALRAVWPPEIWTALDPPYEDPAKLDLLLRFLEEDPFFFRSGYVKEKALGRIGKFPLSDEDRQRIANIVLRAVDTVGRREFGRQANLARWADQGLLRPGLLRRMDGSSDRVAWQAYQAARAAVGQGIDTQPYTAERRKTEIAAMRERLRALSEAR